VIERHDYLPFGEECTTGPCASNPGLNAGQPRKYTGKERDKETGLDYFGARYHGSKIGRFTTVDPVYNWQENLVDPQRWNRYAYARNNPLRYVDPDGREVVSVMGGRMYGMGTEVLPPGTVAQGNQAFGVLVGIASLGLPDPTDAALAPIAARLGGLVGRVLGKGGDEIVSGLGRLGDLTTGEVRQVQSVVDQAGRPLEVVGSAASGTRRGVGTDLPIGKGPGTRSDIDYLIPPSSRKHFEGMESRLPGVDPKTGPIPGTHNPHIGPAVRFEPKTPPRYVPEAK
jgi:RHS repeat-associated protein